MAKAWCSYYFDPFSMFIYGPRIRMKTLHILFTNRLSLANKQDAEHPVMYEF